MSGSYGLCAFLFLSRFTSVACPTSSLCVFTLSLSSCHCLCRQHRGPVGVKLHVQSVSSVFPYLSLFGLRSVQVGILDPSSGIAHLLVQSDFHHRLQVSPGQACMVPVLVLLFSLPSGLQMR